MFKYKVMQENGIDYVVNADYTESQGEWLLFFKRSEHAPTLVHACSSRFIRYITLVTP